MKISYNWLREYVDVKNSARQVAQWLTMAGLEVTSIEERDKDSILELEVTTNRPDWLSFVGVARELSAITGKRLKIPKVPTVLPIVVRDKQVRVEIEDKVLCPRYTARIIDGVRVGPSPEWLKKKLEAVGLRAVNNVVDITNFCLFELGQPLHAFDYDKLSGQAIIVRRARKGEEILTIDGIKRELNSDMLVIADERRPVAVAGVMGGKDTEVTETTKTILLESAYFDPLSIRRMQRKLGLSTDSSYRFERGVDIEMVLFASNRAAKLIAEVCGGKIGLLKDVGTKVARPNVIQLSINKANQILNVDLSPLAAKKILVNLGLKVAGSQDKLRVEVPSFRGDLKREEDLVEEIARLYGYEKIPTTIPRMVAHSERKVFIRKIEELAREVLLSQGLDEVITYSLMDREDLRRLNFTNEEKIVWIANPLSNQQEIMRPTLMPGMLDMARFNLNRKIEDIRIFELSKVYSKLERNKYKEELNLSILLAGTVKMGWRQKIDADFFELKGLVENLFERLNIKNCQFVNVIEEPFHPNVSSKLLLNGAEVGVMGEVKKEVLDNFDIKKKVLLCELRFEELIKFASIEKRARPLPRFLAAKRDVSFIVEKDVHISDLFNAIRSEAADILYNVELRDEYFGAQIPDKKRGLTFLIEYLSEEKQLTNDEIEKAHSRVRDVLVKKFNATIR